MIIVILLSIIIIIRGAHQNPVVTHSNRDDTGAWGYRWISLPTGGIHVSMYLWSGWMYLALLATRKQASRIKLDSFELGSETAPPNNHHDDGVDE